MLVVRKYCHEFVKENTKIMKNLSTCYSRDLVMYRPVRMQPIACPCSRFRNSQTHICDDISIPSQEKLWVYSRKIVTISNILTVMFTRNFDNKIKKFNLREGLSNDVSDLEIHHSYPKISAKTYKKAV